METKPLTLSLAIPGQVAAELAREAFRSGHSIEQEVLVRLSDSLDARRKSQRDQTGDAPATPSASDMRRYSAERLLQKLDMQRRWLSSAEATQERPSKSEE
ncbi:hypothetical protein [Oleiagrimonas sp. C23AA]|uniref:hypothetical protein n=1 Tax=Oleiagrimonas sp. C23AA TaxID=2719047 RepID=UPI001420CEDA|nr:hypothetical protein [Oleiagrimonas sp. C23AA]NII10976.1 hypothetical protein [Oleiagrimonas sp. C23AA]